MQKDGFALITGASSGIGKACAGILAERGYNLIIVARRLEKLETLALELQDKYDIKVHCIGKDLAMPESASELFNYVKHHELKVDVLVNNAGFALYGKFIEYDLSELNRMLNLNVLTFTNLTYLFAREMVRNGGKGYILQLSSVGAFQPSPLYAAYSATKSYVMLFSEALDLELGGSNVSITTLYPGATKTEFHQTAKHDPGKLITMTYMNPDEVARIGIQAMFAGKRSITPGLLNKVNEVLVKFTPRRWITAIAGYVVK